jgi:predicted nucleic acid-binding protein
MDYWDTSALFKLYFPETDSDWFIARFAAAQEPVVTSEIAIVELYCNLLRNERMGRMAPGTAATQFRRFTEHCDTGSIVALGVDRAVVLQAQTWADRAFGNSRPVLIRSLDLLHLSTASLIRAAVVVSTDNRMRDLAVLLRMEAAPS